MMRTIRGMVCLAAVLGAPALCFAEKIDNPDYQSWARFKPGTSVTMTSESDVGGTKTESSVTTALISVTADKAIVEMKLTLVIAGEKTKLPAKKIDVLAKIDKPEEPATEEAPKTKPKDKDKPKIVKEDVEVSGKAYPCIVSESSVVENGIPINKKVWRTDEIPGGLAKMETIIPEGPMKGATTITATSVTIK